MESSISDNDAKFDRSSSEASTPSSGGSYEPFRSKYVVKVTEPIKDGDSVHYTIKTTRTLDSADFSVRREYEDFEYLHHCLMTQNKIDGVIMPPLPPKPAVEPKEADTRSKQQLSSASKVLIGDEFHKDCHALEMYLKLVLSHPTTGESACLEAFLIQKEAPVKAKAKLGFLNKIVSGVWESRKVNHTDIDEFFQKERDAANMYATAIHEASNSFNKMVYSQQRISNAYAHLSTTLSLFNVHSESEGSDGNKVLVKFAEAVDDAKHGSDVDMTNDENTLGFHLDLYSRYAESLKDMLNRRTCLLVNYEDANKLLDKAKPAKKAAAEEAKGVAEKAFEECSEVARIELAAFKRQRLLAFQEALRQHTEAKIKTARDTYTLLAKSLVCFKQMDKQQQPQLA